jgi:hypothetical protein
MSDRGFLFLFSLLMIFVGLGTAVWLFATGQAGTVDGLFLLLTVLLTALVFALYVMFVIHRAMDAQKEPAAKPAKASATPSTAKAAQQATVPQP